MPLPNVTRVDLMKMIMQTHSCSIAVASHLLDNATKPNFYCKLSYGADGHNATLTFITGDSYHVLAERAS